MALLLVAAMMTVSVPPVMAAGFVQETATRIGDVAGPFKSRLAKWLGLGARGQQQRGKGQMPTRQVVPGVKPQPPTDRIERAARVSSLRVNPSGDVVLQGREPLLFAAIPLDYQGSAIHGLHAEWTSSDRQIVFVKKNGQAVAGNPGTAVLTARAGNKTETVRVTVVEGTGEAFGGKKKVDSTREQRQTRLNSIDRNVAKARKKSTPKRQHSSGISRELNATLAHPIAPVTAPFLPNPSDDALPDAETSSLYQPSNVVGKSPYKHGWNTIEPVPPSPPGTTENGQTDFTFGLGIVGMPGRGLDAALSLVYNSQLWNKSVDSSSVTQLTFDVDSGWPSAGFRLGFGQIEDQGSAGFTLTDPDGTRHALVYASSSNYDTNDGSFIHYTGGSGSGTLYYPNGTQITYGAGYAGLRIYPTRITDSNGNYILISYAGPSGSGPKIDSIEDTLERYIQFHYASSGDLVAITAPGLHTSDPYDSETIQVMRFYYASTDINLAASSLWLPVGSGGPHINLPVSGTTAHVLQYVYMPASADGSGAHIGYKFDYSPYGMINQVTQFRGMTVDSNDPNSAGTVTATGTLATITTYNYPTSASNLTDVPSYTQRTDDWAGRTAGSASVYTFANSTASGEKLLTVTAPDGTVTVTHSIDNPGNWNDGLVTDTYTQYGSTPTVLSHTKIDWDSGATTNQRVSQVRTTDVPAGLTKATALSYTTYNNVSSVSERALTTDGTVSSTELRRTDTTYLTSSSYTNRHLLNLASSVKVFPGGSTPIARVDYAYDDYSAAYLTARNDIVMHDPAFDGYQPNQESNCDWVCTGGYGERDNCLGWTYVCDEYNPYDPATDYRGNLTSVKTYPDATADPSSGSNITHATTYDIAGNAMTAQVDCCQLKSISYSSAYDYAYPTSVTSGNPSGVHVTSSATYDFNTGLTATTTDENSQVTTSYYNVDSLRTNHIDRPSGGGSTYFYYGDGLWADTAGHYHYYVMASTQLSSTSGDWADVYQFLDGRGAQAQVFYDGTGSGPWTTRVTEYDTMGRAYQTTNPFSDGGYGGTLTGLWTTKTFDNLGRVTAVSMPSGDDAIPTTTAVHIAYDGLSTTVTDQAGKLRRQKVDALGRVVRLDEPNSSGVLDVSGSPVQSTNYDYDVLGNLVHVNQGAQDRYFKYDSLSRLIRERQVEQTPNSSYNLSDSLTGNSSWTRQISYNSSGLITEADDASGIRTQPTYDGLNRVTQVEYKKWDTTAEGTPTANYYYDSQTLPTGHPSYTPANSAGRLIAMTYGSGATGDYFNYNTLGRITSQWQVTGSTPTTYALSYAYNYAGMLTSETYPNGRVMSYAYGTAGKLSSVGDGTTTFADTFTYGPNGGLTSEHFGNTAVHTVAYNHALQASQVKLTLTGTVLQQFDYDYGTFNTSSGAVVTSQNTGQIGKITGTNSGAAQWNQGFSYDELGRLSTIAEHQGSTMSTSTYSQGFTYDIYGNKKQSANTPLGVIAVAATDYDTTNNNNQFVSAVATYDAAGNILTDSKFRGLTYAYDANGRQSSATNGSWTESQTYDSVGQRVLTSFANGSTTTYRTMVYDIFGQDVADYTESTGGTLERENIYRGGQLLATYEASGTAIKYALQDAQGSTRAIMSNNGSSSTILARHDFMPFGEEISSGIGLRTSGQGYGNSDANRQKYAMLERDENSGLDHASWRKYESFSGRWTSPDPYGGSASTADPQSFNRYSYTQNDPVNFTDPSGLSSHKLAWRMWLFDSEGWWVAIAVSWGLGGQVKTPEAISTAIRVTEAEAAV